MKRIEAIQPNAGIPGISQAVRVVSGTPVFLSGHIAVDATGAVVGSDLETQLVQVFENLGRTLAAAQSSFAAVARLTIYVRDYQPALLPIIRRVRDRYIDATSPPASSLIGVAALAFPELLVEVDAIAVAD